MSAGLAASTVTPGSTAPVGSLTSPARVACAAATRGTAATSPNNRKHLAIVRIVTSWRLVASVSYQASDGTYQRQPRLLKRLPGILGIRLFSSSSRVSDSTFA